MGEKYQKGVQEYKTLKGVQMSTFFKFPKEYKGQKGVVHLGPLRKYKIVKLQIIVT